MAKTNGTLEEDVVAIIRTPDVQGGLADLAEAGLDQLLQEGFLRDVPLLGTVLSTIRAAGSIRDLLLVKKLGRFLSALQAIPLREREEFHNSLGSRDERRRVGEGLLLLLDRLDDMDKPELLARCFRAFLRGRITLETFKRFGSAVDRLELRDLPTLLRFYSGANPAPVQADSDRDIYQGLSFAGLVRLQAAGNGGALFDPSMAGATMSYQRNDLGRRFVMAVNDSLE